MEIPYNFPKKEKDMALKVPLLKDDLEGYESVLYAIEGF